MCVFKFPFSVKRLPQPGKSHMNGFSPTYIYYETRLVEVLNRERERVWESQYLRGFSCEFWDGRF